MSTPESKSLYDLATIAAASLRQVANQRIREVQNTPSIALPRDGAEISALVVKWFEVPQADFLLAYLSIKSNESTPRRMPTTCKPSRKQLIGNPLICSGVSNASP